MNQGNDALSTGRTLAADGRFRAMLQKMPGFVAILAGPNHVFEYANDAYVAISSGRPLIGIDAKSAFADLEGQGFIEALDEVYRTGEPFSGDSMPILLQGEKRQRYIDFVYQPMLDEDGKIEGVFVAGHEVTGHVEALQRASRSEQEMQTLTDALPVLISYMDAEERYQFNNKRYEEWFPRTREEIRGKTIRSVVGEAAYAAVRPKIERVLAGERFQFEQMMPYSDTAHRHIAVEYVPRIATDGTVEGWYALVQDITKTKALEKQREEMTRELAHRIKNSLAVVQSIVSQSMRHAETVEEANASISNRIGALARAQDILVDADWESADVETVVRAALEPHQDHHGRFSIEGAKVGLTPPQSVSLALAVHELATNALKYGALSNENGKVSISWAAAGNQFSFEWVESGGPEVISPRRTGFGSRLIERMVGPSFQGKSQLSYDPAGIRFNLTGMLQ